MNTFIEIPASKRSLSLRKPIHGIGINDAPYTADRKDENGNRSCCPFYKKWLGILTRCYSDKYQEKFPTYIGCHISKEWMLFSNFREWMISQDWEGKHLDKDILTRGNKLYSADVCVFVSGAVNLLLSDCRARRGKYPIGVSWHKRDLKFSVSCAIDGKNKHLGYYDNENDASCAYNKFKSNHIIQIAEEYIDDARLYNGLIAHAELISNGN